ncbi:hypothetical protein AMTR_s00011p00261330 [Amborella trichopoda]|uniref:Uncharacterized protein n=1 Tax=Amborella trichopoda TaxID=13333 RepID=W1NHX3_AMBTC|nr:hypothetical protein AMTR_s00011p00261330 [Amborella trichopoda]
MSVVIGEPVETEPNNVAVVEMDATSPITVIRQDEGPLLIGFTTSSPTHVSSFISSTMADPLLPLDPKTISDSMPTPVMEETVVASIFSDSGMDFNIPIGVVFKELITKQKKGNQKQKTKQWLWERGPRLGCRLRGSLELNT